MANTEQNTGQGIVLQSFEETVVAYGAVQEVWGEDEPLLQPTTEVYGEGHNLHAELYRPDGRPPAEFHGADRRTIIGALWLVAQEKSGSKHQQVAQRMLAEHATIDEAAVAAQERASRDDHSTEAEVALRAARTTAGRRKRRSERLQLVPRVLAAAALRFV